MTIINCDEKDIGLLNRFYDWGRELQKARSKHHWKHFETATLLREISEKRQWKLVDDGEPVAVFLTAYEDPWIWGEDGKQPAVYLHRIVSHPDHRGKNLLGRIINWAKAHAREKNLQFLRMDTWGDNPALLNYYIKFGFELVRIVNPEDTSNLPAHYDCISLGLLEMKL